MKTREGTETSTSRYGFTSLEDALLLPVEMYVRGDDDIHIAFDSGCYVAVTPNKEDLCGPITSVNKTMIGLGATARMEGEGLVEYTFRDDYGVN